MVLPVTAQVHKSEVYICRIPAEFEEAAMNENSSDRLTIKLVRLIVQDFSIK